MEYHFMVTKWQEVNENLMLVNLVNFHSTRGYTVQGGTRAKNRHKILWHSKAPSGNHPKGKGKKNPSCTMMFTATLFTVGGNSPTGNNLNIQKWDNS